MDFGLSVEQALLQETIRRWVDGECTSTRIRAVMESEPGDDWPLRRVAIEALAAGMLLLVLLDTVTRFVGRLY